MNFTILNLFNLPVFNIKPSESFKCNLVHFTHAGNGRKQSECTTRFCNVIIWIVVFFVLTSDNVLSFLHCDLLLDLTVTA